MGPLPMGALPTTGVGGGGCRVGRSAASAALPVASIDTTTQIKCFTPNTPLIVHDSTLDRAALSRVSPNAADRRGGLLWEVLPHHL